VWFVFNKVTLGLPILIPPTASHSFIVLLSMLHNLHWITNLKVTFLLLYPFQTRKNENTESEILHEWTMKCTTFWMWHCAVQ
jgi:hypothetical protein